MFVLSFLAGLFLLTGWLLPIHYKPWLTAYPELIATLGLCLALLGVVLNTGIKNIKAPRVVLAVVALAIVPVAQLTFGVIYYAADAWLSVGFLLVLAASLLVGFNVQLVEKTGESRTGYSAGFAWLLLTAAVISSVIAVLQWLGLADSIWIHPLKPGSRPYANIAQPNNLATLLGFGLAAVLYLFESRRVSAIVSSLISVLIIFGLALAQSRTTLIASLFVIAFWYFQSKRVSLRLTTLQVAAWLALFVIISLCMPLLSELAGLSQGSIVERIHSSKRIDMYLHFIEAIKNGPWFGYGWNQSITAQFESAHLYPPKEVTLYAHNLFLDLMVWNGPLVGSIVIVSLIVLFTRLLLSAKTLTATICWVALSFFIVHSLFEFPYAYTFLLIPAGFMLGALLAEAQLKAPEFKVNKFLLGSFSVMLAASTSWIWYEYTVIEKEHWVAISLLPGQDIPETHHQQLDKVKILKQLSSYTAFVSLPIDGNVNDEMLDSLPVIVKRSPHFYTLLKASYILALNERHELAFNYLITLKYMYGEERFNTAIHYLDRKSDKQPELLNVLKKLPIQQQ